jgi:hypothetical protein
MIIKQENIFRYVVGLTAIFIATVAATFSILGIGMLFSGAYISTVLMATSLETGKIVATSFLYRFWKKISNWLKVYLVIAVVVLMGITSLGIFGWLSAAYQSSAIQFEISQQKTATLVEERKMVQTQVESSKQQLDMMLGIRSDQEKRMNESLNNPVLARNPTALRQVQEQNIDLIKRTDLDLADQRKKYSDNNAELSNVDRQILESKLQTGKTKDIVTFKFVAEALGMDMNTTVKWFIMVIIVVFDPLAISLILAYNIMAYGDRRSGTISGQKEVPTSEPPTEINEPATPPSVQQSSTIVPVDTSKSMESPDLPNFVPAGAAANVDVPHNPKDKIKAEHLKHSPSI